MSLLNPGKFIGWNIIEHKSMKIALPNFTFVFEVQFLNFIMRVKHSSQRLSLSVCLSVSGGSVPGNGQWPELAVLVLK